MTVSRGQKAMKTPTTRVALKRASLGDQASQALRLMIRKGELRPGIRLVETELAEMLGVSRGPVRDALRQLASERLVTISPSRGAVVRVWSPDDLEQLFELRAMLEVEAIRRTVTHSAAECATELAALMASWKQAVLDGNRARCADFDFDFHRAIWRHARNMWLTEALEHLVQPCHTIFYLNTSENRDLMQNWQSHEKARQVIASGDPEAASELMRAHMAKSLAQALEFNESIMGIPE